MKKYSAFLRYMLGGAMVLLPGQLLATGGYYADDVLDKGGKAVETAPEFYWADLVTELARGFRPKEKAVVPTAEQLDLGASGAEDGSATRTTAEPLSPEVRLRFTATCDASDYADAIKTGRVTVADVAAARAENAEQRRILSELSLAPSAEAAASTDAAAGPNDSSSGLSEVPRDFATGSSEFDLYNRGAYAYRVGNDQLAEEIWRELLALKLAKRTYRSTWATYMLGRLAMRQKDWAAASEYFARVRALASGGCKDSLGLAAESYGWQAKCELEMGNKDAATKLYLTQLALGDGTAIDSLKKCLPAKRPEDERADEYFDPDALAGAALDQTRRQLVTAFVLSNLAVRLTSEYADEAMADDCDRWLGMLEKHGFSLGAYAGWGAWVAYSKGSYDQAARWASLSPENDALTQWVRAKLAARKGDFQLAAALLERVQKSKWLKEYEAIEDEFIPKYASFYALRPEWYPGEQSAADLPTVVGEELGASLLSAGRFVEAERCLRQTGNERGAAYIRENLFTVDQHLSWFEQSQKLDAEQLCPARLSHPCTSESAAEAKAMWLAESKSEVGRRLARLARFEEAKAYFSPQETKELGTYVEVLRRAEEKNLSPEETAYRKYAAARFTARARGGFSWSFSDDLPRVLATSELELDGVGSYGCPRPGILEERANSECLVYGLGSSEPTFLPLFVKVGQAEHRRLAAQDTCSPLSYYTAKEFQLLLKAASLLPRDSAEREEMILAANYLAAYFYPESLEHQKKRELVLALREARPSLSEDAADQQLKTARDGINYYGGDGSSAWPKGPFDERYTREFPPKDPRT